MHPRQRVIMERYQEVKVALSESVIKSCLNRPLAEKSRWRHIRLAIKPLYLGSHASPIKSYHETLLGSQRRSFRIRHKKLPEAPPNGEITMTSYPPSNKTSLSRKQCIPDKKLPWHTIRKSWSLFQNPSWKNAWSAPCRRIHNDVISGLQKTSLSQIPCIADKKLILIIIMKSWSLSNFYKKTANINSKILSVYKCC